MRTIFTAAVLLSLGAGAGLAQPPASPAGSAGPSAMATPPATANTGGPDATIPAGVARQENAGPVPKTVSVDQARSTLENACGGTVSALNMDAKDVWHAKCSKDGHPETMTLGPGGVSREP